MAFIPLAALGGAAKSLSKGLKDERDEALKNAGIKIKLLTEMGLPKARARKAKMKSKNDLYDKLDDHFSAPQIAKILQEDKGQAVLDHIQNQRNVYGESGVKPNDIVTLMDEYADLNLTKDQILENVMGKVGRGMTVTDAMKDVAGKGSSLTSFFGGDLSGVGKRQFDSIASATGVSMEELQALASDNITYDDPLVKGTITLSDPATQARAKKALEDSQAGAFTSPSATTALASFGNMITGGEAGLTPNGSILYTPTVKTRGIAVAKEASAIVARKRKELGRNKFTANELDDMKLELDAWAVTNNIHVDPDGTGTGTGTGTAAATGATQNLPTPPTSTNPFAGMTSGTIRTQAIRDAQGLTKTQQDLVVANARVAIINDLSKSMSKVDATKQADDIIADIMTKI